MTTNEVMQKVGIRVVPETLTDQSVVWNLKIGGLEIPCDSEVNARAAEQRICETLMAYTMIAIQGSSLRQKTRNQVFGRKTVSIIRVINKKANPRFAEIKEAGQKDKHIPLELLGLAHGPDKWMRKIKFACEGCGNVFPAEEMESTFCEACFEAEGADNEIRDGHRPARQVVVTVSGGVVQDVDVPELTQVVVQDFDTDGAEESRLGESVTGEGKCKLALYGPNGELPNDQIQR